MVYLAKSKDKICSLRSISEKEDIPFDYLEKIISKLKKANLVKAKRGIQGGYFLTQKSTKIKVGKIIRVLEGKMSLVKCIGEKEKYLCPREKKCLTKNFWGEIQDTLNTALDSLTLDDLILPKNILEIRYKTKK